MTPPSETLLPGKTTTAVSRKVALTDKTLGALKPKSEVYEVRDAACSGLSVRVFTSGSVELRFQGKPDRCADRPEVHRHTLSWEYPAVSLKEARQAVEEARLSGGHSLVPKSAEVTIGVLLGEWFEGPIKARRKRPGAVADIIRRDLACIADVPVARFTWKEAAAPVEAAVKRGSPVHAAKVLQIVKQFSKWASSKYLGDRDPSRSLNPTDLGCQHNVRDRELDATELATFLTAFDRSDLGEQVTRLGLRLLLATALRSQELRTLRWEDITLDKEPMLKVRPEAMKLTLAQARKLGPSWRYVQPLSTYAVGLFEELKALTGEHEHCFPGWNTNRKAPGPMSKEALGQVLERLRAADEKLRKVPKFVPHDFRRCASTWVSDVFGRNVAQEILGHSVNTSTGSGVASTYYKSQGFARKRDAIES